MELYTVNEEVFNKFLEKHKLKKREGVWFHSFEWVNDEGEIMATYESSSWNPHIVYRISDEGFANMETLHTINNYFFK